jgi:hypothetical protein
MNGSDEAVPHIAYGWDSVEMEEGIPFTWGCAVSEYMEQRYSRPGVYRWGIWDGRRLRAVYIGEAEEFSGRFRQYLRPGSNGSTEFRIQGILEMSVQRCFNVRLETLVLAPTILNTIRISQENFSDPFLRRMLENFVIADTDTTQITVLNRVPSKIQRRIDKALRNNPFLEALRQAGFDLDEISL